MKKLLVAVHPGFRHSPAIERVQAIAQHAEVEVRLYSAVYDEHFAGLSFVDGTTMHRTRVAWVEAERQKLDAIKRHFSAVKNISVSAEWCYPAGQGIIAAAHAFDADLIVVSSTRHSTFGRWLLTNTDWDVLRHATCPVLLAHQRPFHSYKTVMAAVDPTHTHDEAAELDHQIVKHSHRLAGYFAGKVHLAHAYPSERTLAALDYVPLAEITEGWRHEHSKAVHALAAEHDIDDAHIYLLDDHPTRAIPLLAKELAADLVVMGVISRSALQGLMISRTTERVLDHLQCDLLAVQVSHG